MKTTQEFEQDILLKEQRVAYWEKYNLVPKIEKTRRWKDEVQTTWI